MKKNCYLYLGISVCLIFSLCLCAHGQSKKISAKYIQPNDRDTYFEFKADGTFYAQRKSSLGTKAVSGKYQLEGNVITCVLPTGQADRSKIEGDVYTDGDGIKWVKETPGMLTDSEKIEKAGNAINDIGNAIADYISATGITPKQAGTYDETSVFYKAICPKYLKILPVKDPWGNNYRVYTGLNVNGQYGIEKSALDDFLVVSFGPLGRVENWRFNPGRYSEGLVNDIRDFKGNLINFNGSLIRSVRALVKGR